VPAMQMHFRPSWSLILLSFLDEGENLGPSPRPPIKAKPQKHKRLTPKLNLFREFVAQKSEENPEKYY